MKLTCEGHKSHLGGLYNLRSNSSLGFLRNAQVKTYLAIYGF